VNVKIFSQKIALKGQSSQKIHVDLFIIRGAAA
jgi:hypothetical protein